MTDILSTFPNEILGAILTIATLTPGQIYSDIDSILNVALVCREWYHIAFSEPRVWNAFKVPLSTDMKTGDDPKWKVVRRWYSRARKLPLMIHLHVTAPSGLEAHTSAVEFLVSMQRWESVSVFLDIEHQLATWTPSPPLPWPGTWVAQLLAAASQREAEGRNPLYGLKRLHIISGAQVRLYVFRAPVFGPASTQDLATLCPRLEYLNLDGIRMEPCRNYHSLPSPVTRSPLKHLTHITLKGTPFFWLDSLDYFPSILRFFPNAESIDWKFWLGRFPRGGLQAIQADRSLTEMLTYPNLKHLKIFDASETFIHIGRLDCPALETLHLRYDWKDPVAGDYINTGFRVHEAILRSQNSLRELKLLKLNFDQSVLFSMLLMLPNLDTLALGPRAETLLWRDGSLFQRLQERSLTEDDVLPLLKDLVLLHEPVQPLLGHFKEFVEDPRRWWRDGDMTCSANRFAFLGNVLIEALSRRKNRHLGSRDAHNSCINYRRGVYCDFVPDALSW